MKLPALLFLLFGFVIVSGAACATTLTIYSVNGRCQYVISENDKAVLRWTYTCMPELNRAESITIKKQSPLARQILKISAGQNLNAIRIIHLADVEKISEFESMKIPVIKFKKLTFKKDIIVNTYIQNTAIAPAQDYNSTRSNKANSITPAQDYNSTRSNKVNSVVTNPLYEGNNTEHENPLYNGINSVGTGNNNNGQTNNTNDSTPVHQEAQDYNSSRSNKHSEHMLVVNINNNNSSDSTSAHQEAQDYNSSRSNKANSISTAQDYNSTRSNKVNSMAPAQDYNSTRSNKANSVVTNPLYEGNNAEHENPLYNGISSAGTGNSNNGQTNTNDSVPPHAEAQNYNSSRSNKANGLVIDVGGISSNSDHSGSGWDFDLAYQAPLSNVISIEAGVGYSSNKFKYKASPLLPEKYVLSMNKNMQDHSWNALSVNVGPVIEIGKEKLYAELYGKAGAVFIKIPRQFVGVVDEKGNVTNQTGVAKFSGNKTAFSVQAGVRINYSISRVFDVFVHPHFFTTLKKNVPYKEKDVSLSLDGEGRFSREKFMSLPYKGKADRMQLVGLNAGIKIHFLR